MILTQTTGLADPLFKLFRHADRLSGLRQGKFSAPIMVDIDPVDGVCNLDCDWCCQAASRASRPTRIMADETMIRLGSFCQAWGVKSWRIAGDSEPLLNKNISLLIESGHAHAIDMGLITNGVYLDRLSKIDLQRLRWLGVSLDAASAETWSSLKHARQEDFHRILENIRRARSLAPELDISIKFLRWNVEESLSKSRFTVPIRKISGDGALQPVLQGNNCNEEPEFRALAERLGVHAILRDSYPKDFPSRYRFAKCVATPLGGVFDASHNFHLCCDARNVYVLTDDYTRDDWRELPSLWGGDRHKEMIASIQPGNCLGCAKYRMNEAIEKYIFADTPDHNFI